MRKNLIRSALLLLVCTSGPTSVAQSFTYVVSGTVMPCNPGDSALLAFTFYSAPPWDTLIAVDDLTCQFSLSLTTNDTYPTVTASMPCNGTIATATDSTFFVDPGQILAYDTLLLDCGGVAYDCAGVPMGPNVQGTPCEDGNPTTEDELWQPDCSCAGDTTFQFDCLSVPGGPNMPGTFCDDLDSLNTNDTWSTACTCEGEPFTIDCNGVVYGPDMPGTLCDDGDPFTTGDMWTASCLCIGYTPAPCAINFQVTQALAFDSATWTSMPIPGTLWVTFQSNGAWPYTYLWDFGDGTTSTEPYPTHTYPGFGPYNLCVTITDGTGCTSTTCDSVAVDPDGFIILMGLGGGHVTAAHPRSGFTIIVLGDVPTTVAGHQADEELTVWPVPAAEEIYMGIEQPSGERVQVRVLDINGRAVRPWGSPEVTGSDIVVLRIDAVLEGMYTIQVKEGGRIRSACFVKVE